MARLKLEHANGTMEFRELSRSQPLTIGRQSFNDICVPDDEVASFHCRVSWNKTGFEVTAATSAGVDVNSTVVAFAKLKPDDLIRVGGLNLVFQDESIAVKPAEIPAPPVVPEVRKPKIAAEPAHKPADSHKHVEKPFEKPADEMSLFEGPVHTESQAFMESLLNDEDIEEEDLSSAEPRKTKSSNEPVGIGMRPVRPGEEEILKSPLVLGLTGGGLVLLLVTGILWFLLSREQSNRMYERAVTEMTDGQFPQSITTFERFIAQYPNHGLRSQADRGLAKALVLKEISGAAPAWQRGLEKLNDLIKAHRKDSDFNDLHSSLFQYSEQISLGAAKSAETAHDPELLNVSKEAQSLLERYADPSTPPTGTIGRINEQRLKAERAIEKHRTFEIAMKTVDAAIAAQKPMAALSERERLVKLFPDFTNSRRVKEALQKSLDLERSVVVVDETEVPAETVDEPPPKNEPMLGLFQVRSRTDETSQGRIVFVMAKDLCYAVDAVTGELVWRRVIGANSPCFPVISNGAQALVLLFDTRSQSMLACQLATGKLVWKQRLNARAIGKPLVHDGQIYLPIEGHSLVRMEVDTGRLSAKATFSQDLASTPALAFDGDHLLVPGQMAMIYALTLRTNSSRQPLTAIATTFTDHAAGSVTAPPLSMGRLLLLCENDQADSAKLRLWDAGNPAKALTELSSTRTAGQVRDTPVLRGNQLVIPSGGEQFSAFAVTDESGRAGISLIGEYKAEKSQNRDSVMTPLFVALGPDGQFWSAGSAFRKFEIGSNNIRMETNSAASGIASQPLQAAGEYFYVGRKSQFRDAVTFSAIDREKLISPWRCILGDASLELVPIRDGGVLWAGESGTMYTLSKNRLLQGGVDLKSGIELELPAKLTKPIRATALHDQRLIVIAAADTTELLLFNSVGQMIRKFPLDDYPQTDPILLDDGLVLPLSARLKLLSLSSEKLPGQDWIAPVGETLEHHWTYLIRLGGRELVACDDGGSLRRIQFRTGEVPHLAEVAKLQFEHSINVRPVLRGEILYVADAGGKCRQLNTHSFDTDGERDLPEPIKNLWSVGPHLLVEAGDRKLYCLADGKTLPDVWAFELNDLEPIGSTILKDDALWIACRSGTILVLNPATGAEIRRIVLPQSLSLGLRQINDNLIAIASDGTIYRVE